MNLTASLFLDSAIYEAFLPRIFLAVILGAIIGIEREITQKSAGLRTHILVTMGATIFTLVSISDLYHGLSFVPGNIYSYNHVAMDPTRIAAQVVSGIGFIGGGAVLRYGTTIRGLTTAASLWTMASIGMLVGVGEYKLAIVATLLAFLVLFTVGKIERHFFRKSIHTFNRLRISLKAKSPDTSAIHTWIEQHFHNKIIEVKTQLDNLAEATEMDYVLIPISDKVNISDLSKQISRLPGIISSSVKSFYEGEDNS